MHYKFEKFTSNNVRLENRITITKTFSIGFPTKFFKDNEIDNYRYVVLYFDRSSSAIGIRFINDETEKGKISIMKSKQGYGGHIIARSFFKTNNLDVEKLKGRYDWKKMTTGELGLDSAGFLYIIDLNQKEE